MPGFSLVNFAGCFQKSTRRGLFSMNLIETPHLSKWPFFMGDAALLLTAGLIAHFHPHPFSVTPLLLITACVAAGAFLAALPFLADYASQQEDAARSLRESVDAQFRKLLMATDSLSHAIAQLKALDEAATKTLHAAEKLPYRLQEKIAEFNEQLTQADEEQKEQLSAELTTLRAAETERLEQLVAKVQKTAAEWSALEATAQQQITAAGTAAAKAQAQIAQAAADASMSLEKNLAAILTREIDPRIKMIEAALARIPVLTEATKSKPPQPTKPAAEPAPDPVPVPSPKMAGPAAPPPPLPAPAAAPLVVPVASASVVEPVAVPAATAPTPPAAPEVSPAPEPKKKRAPRKPKPEPAATAEIVSLETETSAPFASSPAPAGAPGGELIVEPLFDDAPAEDFSQLPPEERAAPAATPAPTLSFHLPAEEGRTKLFVTAYIGIGNKLHVRGEGGGLNWNKGVPLSFVSIGKWSWTAPDNSGPITCKLFKNDRDEAKNGVIAIEPGQQTEVSAIF